MIRVGRAPSLSLDLNLNLNLYLYLCLCLNLNLNLSLNPPRRWKVFHCVPGITPEFSRAGLAGEDDLSYGLGLSLRLCLSHEVDAGCEAGDVVRAGFQVHHLAPADVEQPAWT